MVVNSWQAIRQSPWQMFVHRLRLAGALALVFSFLLASAPGRPLESTPVARAQGDRVIHVISNGWHSGLVVRVKDLPRREWAVTRDFPGADYLVISWGDAAFYQAKKVTLRIFLAALFLPTPSALHVVPVHGKIERAFAHSDLVRMTLSPAEFRRFTWHLGSAFVANANGKPRSIGPGLSAISRFYASHGAYYFPKTCNVWTARQLRYGGCKVMPPCALTADDLIWQAKRTGVHVQRKRRPADPF